jgi:uncharacterized protein involved in exopolysaccharide biosynthesis
MRYEKRSKMDNETINEIKRLELSIEIKESNIEVFQNKIQKLKQKIAKLKKNG